MRDVVCVCAWVKKFHSPVVKEMHAAQPHPLRHQVALAQVCEMRQRLLTWDSDVQPALQGGREGIK